jgi:hypothetical protein
METFDYFEEIAKCRYLFLEEIGEPFANQFRVLIVVGEIPSIPVAIQVAGSSLGDGLPVNTDEHSLRYELTWPSYVLYQIVNESFAQPQDPQKAEAGKSVFIYNTSNLLEFVSRTTLATDEYPGKLIHLRILCQDHAVDVISVEPPLCRKIEPQLRIN